MSAGGAEVGSGSHNTICSLDARTGTRGSEGCGGGESLRAETPRSPWIRMLFQEKATPAVLSLLREAQVGHLSR